jgi:hypothetical protein
VASIDYRCIECDEDQDGPDEEWCWICGAPVEVVVVDDDRGPWLELAPATLDLFQARARKVAGDMLMDLAELREGP